MRSAESLSKISSFKEITRKSLFTMHLNENCPITKQIDNIDDTIKELNLRIGKFNSEKDL